MTRILSSFMILWLCACNNPVKEGVSSNISEKENTLTFKNKTVYELPEDLKEISGITFLNDSVLVAIQDEDGMLFYYNLRQKRIIKTQQFGDEDDYEDVARVENDIYVITSKGLLIQIQNFQSTEQEIITYITPFGKRNDVEGLAYDKANNRLLIGPKEEGLTEDKTSKHIYSFDLKTKTVSEEPVFTIKLSEIETYFEGDALEESSKKFLKALGNNNMNKVFRSSAIAVQETTGEIYVLSSINGIIAVLHPDGRLKNIRYFTGPEFIQPEGLAFSPNGKLYISNEGDKSNAGNIIEMTHEK